MNDKVNEAIEVIDWIKRAENRLETKKRYLLRILDGMTVEELRGFNELRSDDLHTILTSVPDVPIRN